MYGGSVISCAVDARARCRIESCETLTFDVSGEFQSIDLDKNLNLCGDRLDVARAAFSYLVDFHKTGQTSKVAIEFPMRCCFKLTAETDVPMQAGLAGSTAILTAIMAAILSYSNVEWNNWQLAEMVGECEFHRMGIICGYQDQYMTSLGGLNYMDFRGKEKLQHKPGTEPFATVESLSKHVNELPMLLAHTGVSRHSGKVHKSVRLRWEEGEPLVVKSMERIAELARVGKGALLSKDWQTVGELMNENHAIVRELGGSGESNECLIKAALEGGAIGAKLAGAGGGGTIIVLTLDPQTTKDALQKAGAEQFLALSPSSSGVTVKWI